MGIDQKYLDEYARTLKEGPDDPRHGTTTGYRYGCRCGDCREAYLAYQRDYRARTGYQRKRRARKKALKWQA